MDEPIIRKVSFLLLDEEANPQIDERFRFTVNLPNIDVEIGGQIFAYQIFAWNSSTMTSTKQYLLTYFHMYLTLEMCLHFIFRL